MESNNTNINKLLNDRYYLKNENSWDQIAKRVSDIYPPIYNYIKNKQVIPSSPTLMNANTDGERVGTLSSCFPMKITDSIRGIYGALGEAAEVTKMGGGIGYDFSILRSSNENVSKINRNSSGPLPFIGDFNSMLDSIQQGGVRRGAGMALLSIYHPDILQFIKAKEDTSKYNRFNFSVKVPSSFYEKLEKEPNSIHKVKNVVSEEEFDLLDSNGKPVTVKKLWDLIIYHAWKTAEPGIFNETIAFNRCTTTNLDKTVICNPCLTGDTKILTTKGEVTIKELTENGEQISLYTLNEHTGNIEIQITDKIWMTQPNAEVYRLELHNGEILKLTEDHRVYTQRGWVEAQNLNLTDEILTFKNIESYTFTPIKQIQKLTQREDVYDISVKNNHNFFANNLLVHNCSEFVNIPLSSCNLGSINLSLLCTSTGTFAWSTLEDIVIKTTHFLDEVIDKNNYPIKEIKETTLNIRPIGLGVMGLAHALYKMGIPYNSKAALEFTKKLIYTITINSMTTSIKMCKDGKKPYPALDLELFKKANSRFWKGVNETTLTDLFKALETYGIRNSCFTSIAPTGSISYIANTSGGIEPVFALAYSRKIEKLDHQYDVVYLTDPIFEEYLDNHYADKKIEILKEVTDNKGSCQKSKYLTEKEKTIFQVAVDLTPDEHLQMLAVVANNTSLSVSKTINLPKECDLKDISDVFIKAHKLGVIGVTVYRDGCREGILVHNLIDRKEAPPRPHDLPCDIWDINVDSKRYIVTIGLLHGKIYEAFVTTDSDKKVDLQRHKRGFIKKLKSHMYNLVIKEEDEEIILIEDLGKTFDDMDIGLSRMTSLCLRSGVSLPEIIKQLDCSKGFFGFKKSMMRILKKYIVDGEKVGDRCPECNEDMVFIEGCISCPKCGYSKCG